MVTSASETGHEDTAGVAAGRSLADTGRVKANLMAARVLGSGLGMTALAVVLGAPGKWIPH